MAPARGEVSTLGLGVFVRFFLLYTMYVRTSVYAQWQLGVWQHVELAYKISTVDGQHLIDVRPEVLLHCVLQLLPLQMGKWCISFCQVIHKTEVQQPLT